MTLSVRALLAAAAGAALLVACSSMARPKPTPAPWWSDASPTLADSTALDTTAGTAPDSAAAAGKRSAAAARLLQDTLGVQLSDEALAARHRAYAARTGADRDRVRQVNEYAYWCLDRDMWDEARIHLERALETDSLAASLHNNLGIVYERMGRRGDALEHYRTAAQLRPGSALYETNLKRLRAVLQHPRQAVPDSLGEDLLLPPPRGDRRPDFGAEPHKIEEADREP